MSASGIGCLGRRQITFFDEAGRRRLCDPEFIRFAIAFVSAHSGKASKNRIVQTRYGYDNLIVLTEGHPDPVISAPDNAARQA
jgi:hypothetical protein